MIMMINVHVFILIILYYVFLHNKNYHYSLSALSSYLRDQSAYVDPDRIAIWGWVSILHHFLTSLFVCPVTFYFQWHFRLLETSATLYV